MVDVTVLCIQTGCCTTESTMITHSKVARQVRARLSASCLAKEIPRPDLPRERPRECSILSFYSGEAPAFSNSLKKSRQSASVDAWHQDNSKKPRDLLHPTWSNMLPQGTTGLSLVAGPWVLLDQGGLNSELVKKRLHNASQLRLRGLCS